MEMTICISDMENMKDKKKQKSLKNPHIRSFFHEQLKLTLPELQ